ncbi:hypothetical protein [Actinomyces marmotae]|uniref:Uncharacterized protein n=1 Tax=Actinomyces marmotae TaxID=2737173 RepID=A0A6M8AZW5_9ACTO|nr:hypothetical protein [Actinomyces marmotae]QKD78972.1 hypothetical protein HPC72_00670 [Actinomyces marmotae]
MLATVVLPALQIVLILIVGFLTWRSVQVAAQARSEAQAARSEAAARAASSGQGGGVPPEVLSRIEEQLRRLGAARAADTDEQHHAAPSERLMSEKADAYRGFLREIASENTHIGTGRPVQTSDAAEEALSRLRSVTVLMGSEAILRSLRNFSIIRGQRPRTRWTEPAIMAYARLQVCLVQAIRRDLDTASEPLSPEETWASMSTGTADPAFRLAMLTPISEVLHHAGQDLSLYDLREEPTAHAWRSAASASSAQRAQTGPITPIEQPIAVEPAAYQQRINRPKPTDHGTHGRGSAGSAPSAAPSHKAASASSHRSTAQIPPTEARIPDRASSPTPSAPGASSRRPVHAPGRTTQGSATSTPTVRLSASSPSSMTVSVSSATAASAPAASTPATGADEPSVPARRGPGQPGARGQASARRAGAAAGAGSASSWSQADGARPQWGLRQFAQESQSGRGRSGSSGSQDRSGRLRPGRVTAPRK